MSILKILSFLSFLDESGQCISWTNIGLAAVLMKFIVAPSVDWQSLVALVSVLANYAHKRVIVSKVSNDGQGIPQISSEEKQSP